MATDIKSRLAAAATDNSDPGFAAEARRRYIERFGEQPPSAPQEPTKVGGGEAMARSAAEGFLPGVHNLMAVGTALGDYLAQKTTDAPVKNGFEQPFFKAEKEQQSRLAAGEQQHPIYSGIGGIAGSIAGLPGMASQKAVGLVDRLAPVVAKGGMLRTAAKGAAKGIAAYELAAPATSAVSSFARDADVGNAVETAGHAATSPLGLGLGAAGGALGENISSRAEKLRSPQRQSGRILEDVKKAGGEVNAIGDEPVSGGMYEKPALKNAPEGREGVNEVSGKAAKAMTKYNRMKLEKTRTDYGNQFDDIVNHSRVYRLPPANLSARMAELASENTTAEGEVIDPALHSVLEKYRALTSTDDGLVSAPDIIKMKKVVDAASEHGLPSTAQNRPYRMLGEAVAKDAEAIDPRLGPLNEKYKADLDELRRANDLTYGQDKPDIKDRAATERAATGRLGRVGDPTQAGTVDSAHMKELAGINPVYDTLITRVKAKKAQEALRYDNEGAGQEPIETINNKRTLPVIGKPLEWLGMTPRDQAVAQMRLGLPANEALRGRGLAGAGSLMEMDAEEARKKIREQELRRLQDEQHRRLGKR